MAPLPQSIELTRKLTGEISVGYIKRHYEDPTLLDLRGLIFDAALKWEATGLTTATLTELNRRITQDRATPANLAKDFVNGLR